VIPALAFPVFRPVAGHAVLAEFGDKVGAEVHRAVLQLYAALEAKGFDGYVESVPAYVNLLVVFDPLLTDHGGVGQALRSLLSEPAAAQAEPALHEIPVCYDADLSPDLAAVATAKGQPEEAVIKAHLAGAYSVYLYGFAPGYAYLSGVPDGLHLPRKPAAVRDVAAGSVLIAGGQCIVSTLRMPTGWWIIGRSPAKILKDDPAKPFLFDVGDRVRFRRITRAEFDARAGG
jgi:inhibitor of KinA